MNKPQTTIKQREAALKKELATRVLARRSLLQYTKRFHPSYEAGWVHEDMCRRLEQFSRDVADKKSPRLMLLMPPRSGKSELASIRFPAWHLGHHPEHEIINCGYNLDLPMKFSRKVREQLRDKAYLAMFPESQLDAESQSVEAWNTTAGGGFTAAGVGGGITGKGAHCVPAETLIHTEHGLMSALDLYSSLARTRVWSFDHESKKFVLRPVVAMQRKLGSAIVALSTESGRTLRCTEDHRVFTEQRGYIAAREVRAGEQLVVATQPGVPQVEGDAVSMVVDLRPGGEWVYDFQVAGTHNFIADEVLVHNCLLIDDPVKNMEEADSAVVRDGLWDWYWSTAYTRLAPGGGVLLVQTLWHDDDLAGRLHKQMLNMPDADQFVIIKYPALAEADEYLTPDGDLLRVDPELLSQEPPPEGSRLLRPKGESLHPERYPTKMMENYRANMHPRIWSALYQQNPVPDEGMYFKAEWFRTEPTAPMIRKRRIYQAWDFAIGEKQQNDFTVGATLLHDENNFLHVLDIVRFKGDTFVIIEEILNMLEKWSLYPDTPVTIGFEDGQIWRAIKPVLEMRMQERNLFPPYEVLKPLTDKLVRARALQGRMQQGRVMFLDAEWLHGLKQEMMRFPAGAHDDMVDALAWACNLVVNKAPPTPDDRAPVTKSWKDKLSGLGKEKASHMAA